MFADKHWTFAEQHWENTHLTPYLLHNLLPQKSQHSTTALRLWLKLAKKEEHFGQQGGNEERQKIKLY